jgi:hypothetical protein
MVKKMGRLSLLLILFFLIAATRTGVSQQNKISVRFNSSCKQTIFAGGEIKKATDDKGFLVSLSKSLNIPVDWEMDFWQQQIDQMVRDRYNVISLWSENPFLSLVKIPEFPKIALNDVYCAEMKQGDDFDRS